tara:strand:- start:2211 stop:3131 length:921 start_codon:yes stop_codon:yes gene_type:complete
MPNENANTGTIETGGAEATDSSASQSGVETQVVETTESFQHKTKKDEVIDGILAQYEKAEKEKELSAEELAAQKEEEWKSNGMLKGESFQQIYDQADEPTKRVLAEFRKQWTQSNQELSREKKEIASLKKQLLQQQSTLTNSDAFKGLQELANTALDDGFELDPFNPESVKQWREMLKVQQAKMMMEIYEPLQQEQLKAQAQMNLRSFMDENPDLQTDQSLRSDVHKMLTDNPNMDLPQAYRIVKGERMYQEMQSKAQLQQQEQQAQRQIGRSIVGNGNTPSKSGQNNRKLSAYEMYEQELKNVGK